MADHGNAARIGQGNSAGEGGNRARVAGWGAAVVLLLLPFAAMQIVPGWNWDAADFLAFAVMLALAGGAFELGTRMSGNGFYRAGFAVAVAAALMLVWGNLAVGFFGDEDNPANLMFAGVIGVAMVGAALARLRAAGMARAMLATAAAQGLAGAIGLAAGLGSPGGAGLYEAVLATTLFGALWLAAAWLFHRAAV